MQANIIRMQFILRYLEAKYRPVHIVCEKVCNVSNKNVSGKV